MSTAATIMHWLSGTDAAQLVRSLPWLSPTLEILHFAGTALLVGVVSVIDLQVLGFAPGARNHSLRPLLPWALAGFATNVLSGTLLVAAQPEAFVRNTAFKIKMSCILLAGANALWSQVVSAPIRTTGDAADAGILRRRSAKLAASFSLLLWVVVIACGRLIPFLPGS